MTEMKVEETDIVRIYPKRYVILALCLFHVAITSFQSTQYSSISDVVATFYGVSQVMVMLTACMFGLNYVLFFHVTNIFLENFGLRKSVNFAVFLNALGTCLKCFHFGYQPFYFVLLGQFLTATCSTMFFVMFSTITAVWFGAKELATTKTLIGACSPLGMGLGFIMRAMIDDGNIAQGLRRVSFALAGPSVVMFLAALVFVEEKPPSPPSFAEKHKKTEQRWGLLLTNVNYMLLLVGYATFGSVSVTLVAILNEAILSIVPADNTLVTVTGFLLTLPGIFGPIFGWWLDKVKNYRQWATFSSSFILVSTTIFWLGFTIPSTTLIQVAATLLALAFTSFILISPDVAVEITYPFSESRATGLLQVPLQLLSFFVTPLFSYLIGTIGASSCILIQIVFVALATIAMFSVKWELKRESMENSAPLMEDASCPVIVVTANGQPSVPIN